jgi:hypothetical protein
MMVLVQHGTHVPSCKHVDALDKLAFDHVSRASHRLFVHLLVSFRVLSSRTEASMFDEERNAYAPRSSWRPRPN